jgi:hypothetical protein
MTLFDGPQGQSHFFLKAQEDYKKHASQVKCLIPIIQRAAIAKQAKTVVCELGVMVLLLQFFGF